jgi:hypothetical protein
MNKSRTLIIVDIENAAGTPLPTPADCEQIRWLVEEFAGDGEFQVIVACSHLAARQVAFNWTGSRHLWASGEDGADKALLEVIADENVGRRFQRVVLVSGDGIFADAVAWLGAQGVVVEVLSRRDSLSRRLRMAATRTVSIEGLIAELQGAQIA